MPILAWFGNLFLTFIWNKLTALITGAIKSLVARWRKNKKIDDAMDKATGPSHDQRDLEREIGNPNPGNASGEPGAVIQDGLPPNVEQ